MKRFRQTQVLQHKRHTGSVLVSVLIFMNIVLLLMGTVSLALTAELQQAVSYRTAQSVRLAAAGAIVLAESRPSTSPPETIVYKSGKASAELTLSNAASSSRVYNLSAKSEKKQDAWGEADQALRWSGSFTYGSDGAIAQRRLHRLITN